MIPTTASWVRLISTVYPCRCKALHLYSMLLLMIPWVISAQNTLVISGGHLNTTNGTIITLQDTNWDNDGTAAAPFALPEQEITPSMGRAQPASTT